MIEINIKCEDMEDACTMRDYLCESLVGCTAFIENDIIVSDPDEKTNIVPIYLGANYGTMDLKLAINKLDIDMTTSSMYKELEIE